MYRCLKNSQNKWNWTHPENRKWNVGLLTKTQRLRKWCRISHLKPKRKALYSGWFYGPSLHTANRTDKRGSHEDDVGAQAGCVDVPSVLRSLQHPHVVQFGAGDIQTLRPEGQAMIIHELMQCRVVLLQQWPLSLLRLLTNDGQSVCVCFLYLHPVEMRRWS